MEWWCVGDAAYAATVAVQAFTVAVYAKTVTVLHGFFLFERRLFLLGRPWVEVFDPRTDSAFTISHTLAKLSHPFMFDNLFDLVTGILRP